MSDIVKRLREDADMKSGEAYGDNAMTDKSAPSAAAIKACAQWLDFCLKIGWHKSQLDALGRLWLKYHDD